MSVPANSSSTVPASINSLVINLITDALNNPKATTDDLLAVFNGIKGQLAHELIAHLPTIEEKAEALIAMGVKKAEAGCVGCLPCRC